MPIEGIPPPGEGALPVLEAAAVRAVGAGRLSLQIGQILQATVIGTSAEKTLLDLRGSSLSVGRFPGLEAGAEVLVRVTGLTPQPSVEVERIVTAAAKPAVPLALGQEVEAEVVSLIRSHLNEATLVGASLANVQQALGRFAADDAAAGLPSVARLQAFLQTLLNSQAAPNAQDIARLVQDGGLHYEAKLAALAQGTAAAPAQAAAQGLASRDLKGLLLQVQQDLMATTAESSLSQAHVNLSNLVTSYLGHLETQQGLNLLAQLHGTPYQLPIPLFTGHAFSTVYLGIEPDAQPEQEGQEDPRGGFNLFFHLDLEEYGQTKIDVRILPHSIRVNFFAARMQAVAELRSALPTLQQALRTVGFDEVLLAADPLDDLPLDKAHRFAPLLAGMPSNVHLLDEKV